MAEKTEEGEEVDPAAMIVLEEFEDLVNTEEMTLHDALIQAFNLGADAYKANEQIKYLVEEWEEINDARRES